MLLTPGDPAPWFTARSTLNPKFQFDMAAGRYLVLCFFRSAGSPQGAQILRELPQHRHAFDDFNASFFGVTIDPEDERNGRAREQLPGIRFFYDFDQEISRKYGAAPASESAEYIPHTLILTPGLRTIAQLRIAADATDHIARVVQILKTLPPIATLTSHAPVLIVPAIFEREFCRELIELYHQNGGEESGFMVDADGKTVGVIDYNHKRRKDYHITDERIIKSAQQRIHRRLVPEIKRAFQFNATRIERHMVGCYAAADGGHFRMHRDNTTLGTAHRRFAVTINLNAEEFEGGDLRFPEFGPRTYRAPTGGAVVFSCSLAHEASAVARGVRYVFLPFLYDDEAAKIRQANAKFLTGETTQAEP
jgi:peroxiredoxin/predicted 2-oxoglutarate/Fe(II)-dependent dioxygenase YbiX